MLRSNLKNNKNKRLVAWSIRGPETDIKLCAS